MTNLATAATITRFQDPAQARVRELEASVRSLLKDQLRAEQENRRLRALACQLDADLRKLRGELERARLREGRS